MKVLHMTLKREWFDMILSGEKKEEYREIKPYWEKRFTKEFDIVRFRCGYGRQADAFDIELRGIVIARGNPAWGAPDEPVYVLVLGNILSRHVKESLTTGCNNGLG